MIILIICLAMIAIFSIVKIYKVTAGHFYNNETAGEVVGHRKHYDDSDYPDQVTGYSPIIRFTVDGREYQGEPEQSQVWPSPGRHHLVTVLYDPGNPAKFIFKEDGTGQIGCVYLIVSIIAIIGIIWIILANPATMLLPQ